MDKPLTLAYSTCPNDTYIFYALAHKRIDSGGLDFSITLNDVEFLNQAAPKSVFDVTKLSFSAIGHLNKSYGLLRTGAALGRNCGPLLISRPEVDFSKINSSRIAVPGLWTTANLLVNLYLKDLTDINVPETVPLIFDEIMPAVASGKFDFGVIIHEGRFTYQNYNLKSLVDLGEWWESETNLPIPLGGIAIRRNLPDEIIRGVELAIQKSIEFAHLNPSETDNYVKTHAQELAVNVIRSHIGLYVNKFTIDIGDEGETAIMTLFDKAARNNIFPKIKQPLFA